MRFQKLDLNLLVALDHLMTLRSISRAAEKMNLSQSAMSNALNRLRLYFEDPLLVQVGRRMELTPKAEAMQRPVRDILVRVEATISTDAAFDPASSQREFSILVSDYSLTVLIPKMLEIAARERATVKFNLLPQSDMPYLTIERGAADLLITPRLFTSPDHPLELLYEDSFVIAAWSEGRYAEGPLTTEEYEAAQHVLMVPPVATTTFETEFLRDGGINRHSDVRCYSFAALPHLVVGTDRLATVHRLIALKECSNLALTLHPLPFSAPLLDQCLQWHIHKEQDPGLLWLRGVLKQAAAEMMREIETLNP